VGWDEVAFAPTSRDPSRLTFLTIRPPSYSNTIDSISSPPPYQDFKYLLAWDLACRIVSASGKKYSVDIDILSQ
jgi:hypothetical protein